MVINPELKKTEPKWAPRWISYIFFSQQKEGKGLRILKSTAYWCRLKSSYLLRLVTILAKMDPKLTILSFSGNLFIKFFFFFALSKTANITQFCKKICNYPVKLGLNPCICSGFIRFWCSEKHEYWVVQLNSIQCISTKDSNCTIFKYI